MHFFFIVLVLAAAFTGTLLVYARKSKPRSGQRPIWHYLLLWPILLEKDRRNDNSSSRMLSTRETIGWLIVVLLIIAAIVFDL
jgi:hypothetical protein